mmetsp:Transcript_34062/g.55530  ORF Transcript_34062/g.55530 Transcript_34062/m.55530 type:complete len:218 (+) Transcript_34062:266-919(+)
MFKLVPINDAFCLAKAHDTLFPIFGTGKTKHDHKHLISDQGIVGGVIDLFFAQMFAFPFPVVDALLVLHLTRQPVIRECVQAEFGAIIDMIWFESQIQVIQVHTATHSNAIIVIKFFSVIVNATSTFEDAPLTQKREQYPRNRVKQVHSNQNYQFIVECNLHQRGFGLALTFWCTFPFHVKTDNCGTITQQQFDGFFTISDIQNNQRFNFFVIHIRN